MSLRVSEDEWRVDGTAERFPGAGLDLVLLVASMGGLEALRCVISQLPANFPTPMAVVLHLSPAYPSRLPMLLRSWGHLPVAFAAEGDRLRAGLISVAPPDRHLVVRADGRFGLRVSEKVNYTRPAADPLFTTAAACFGRRTLAVVLSGMGRDGTAGALAVRSAGGVVIAQDPGTAAAANMPAAVVASGAANLVLPLERIPSALTAFAMVPGATGLLGSLRPDDPTTRRPDDPTTRRPDAVAPISDLAQA